MKAIISFFTCLFFLTFFIPSQARVIDSEGKSKYVGRFVFDTVPMNLKELSSTADRIFTGICTDSTESFDNKSKVNFIKYTFKVSENIKGVKGKSEVTFKQWKPLSNEANYETGKKYIIFLYPNSPLGLTSPVGYLQGLFDVNLDADSNKEIVVDKVYNVDLNKRLRSKVISTNNSSHLDQNRLRVNYDDFVRTIREVLNEK